MRQMPDGTWMPYVDFLSFYSCPSNTFVTVALSNKGDGKIEGTYHTPESWIKEFKLKNNSQHELKFAKIDVHLS